MGVGSQREGREGERDGEVASSSLSGWLKGDRARGLKEQAQRRATVGVSGLPGLKR